MKLKKKSSLLPGESLKHLKLFIFLLKSDGRNVVSENSNMVLFKIHVDAIPHSTLLPSQCEL